MLILEKWHSIGNDFLISRQNTSTDQIIQLLDRNFGLGADRFILLQNNSARFFNPDGSEAEICGNALKCIAEIVSRETSQKTFTIHTKKGEIKAKEEDGLFALNLGSVLGFEELKEGFFVNLGNPHLVVFCNQMTEKTFFESEKMQKYVNETGAKMQKKFKKTAGINVSFVLAKSNTTLLVRTFERGVGETFSCGSGSTASFFAAFQKGLVLRETKVFNKGSKKVLAFKESYHLISYNEQNLILKGKGTKLAEIIIK